MEPPVAKSKVARAFRGQSGREYVGESSTDLERWTVLGAQGCVEGAVEFTTDRDQHFKRCFHRLRAKK